MHISQGGVSLCTFLGGGGSLCTLVSVPLSHFTKNIPTLSPARVYSCLRGCGLEGAESDPQSKLSPRQLFKLALRMVRMYQLDLSEQ